MSIAFQVLLVPAYVAAHLLLYGVVLRKRQYFRTETGIFRLHLCSFLLLPAVLAVMLLSSKAALPATLTVLIYGSAFHGIYSLSFLELWSLTQGSYSISLLRSFSDTAAGSAVLSQESSAEIGFQKIRNRTEALVSMGLLGELEDGRLKLTALGKIFARILRFVQWLSATEPLNR